MRAVAMIVASGLLAGCVATPSPLPVATPSPSPQASAPSPTTAAMVTDHLGRLSVTHPAAWLLTSRSLGGVPVPPYYLSTDRLTLPPCTTPDPATQQPGSCPAPVMRLSDNGVLVAIGPTVSHFPPLGSVPPPSVTSPDASCLGIGGTQEVGAHRFPWDVTACLRGPDLATSIAEVEAVIASITG